MLDYATELSHARSDIFASIDRWIDALLGGETPVWHARRQASPRRQRRAARPQKTKKLDHLNLLIDDAFVAVRRLEDRKRQDFQKITSADIALMRAIGISLMDNEFAQNDDGVTARWVDVSRGCPSMAFVLFAREWVFKGYDGTPPPYPSKDGEKSAWHFVRIQEIAQLPYGQFPSGPGYAYEMQLMTAWNRKRPCQAGSQYYYTIDREGRIHPCFSARLTTVAFKAKRGWNNISKSEFQQYDRAFELENEFVPYDSPNRHVLGCRPSNLLSFAISAWQNMHDQPIAEFSDGTRKILVSVTMENHAEMFVKRNVDRSGKALHWVRSHMRDGDSGASPVRTHLRGNPRFIYRGYNVDVVMPGNNDFATASARRKIRPMMNDHGAYAYRPSVVTHNPLVASILGSQSVSFMSRGQFKKFSENETYGPIPPLSSIMGTEPVVRCYYKNTVAGAAA